MAARSRVHKPKTVGPSPKVPIQAAVTVLTFLLGYLGIDLPPEVAFAVAVLFGSLGGAMGPLGKIEGHHGPHPPSPAASKPARTKPRK
jgi:hypothetical protein